ncbi:helix-turn-helix domain-containing protein [Chryseobacterium geocarposphaerae]|nr:AraC family transcriptional regulator [Chryseobacterium geocarposphaerae]
MLLQLKVISEKLSYEKGIFLSSDFLMTVYNKQDRNKEIIELGNQLKKIIDNKKEDPTGVISSIYQKQALALMYLGLDDESKKDIEIAIRFAKTIKNPDRRYLRMAQSYMDMHSYYNNMNNIDEKKIYKDSTLYYLNQSLETAEKIRDNNKEIPNNLKYKEIIDTYIRLGIFYLEYSNEKGNLALAEKNLLKAKNLQESKKVISPREETTLQNQLSWLYLEKKEYQKSIDYANYALQLEKKQKRPSSRVESFEFLATSYMEIGEKEKSKFYMRKYANLKDSLNIANRSNANTTMKKMVKKVEDENKESAKKQWIITGVLALVAGLITAILWRKKNNALRRKYEQIMINLKNEKDVYMKEDNEGIDLDNIEESNDDLQAISNKNTISADTEARILKKLAAFEKSEKYLKKDLTISSLAAQLNTNTKYLSEVIKNNTSQNFNHYINNLRINYIVHKLYNEPKYREYKISYLAEECGYASSQVFVIAFKKINGLTPSYFIQNLKEDKVNIPV